jgi:hypothetical protein
MDKLFIKATKSSPEIYFDNTKNFLSIKGESYPENTASFYMPVLSWVEEYLQNLEDQDVTVGMDIPYFNSSSSKILLDFLDMLDEAVSKGKKIVVNWFYAKENQSALEAGEEIQEDFKALTFHIIQLPYLNRVP